MLNLIVSQIEGAVICVQHPLPLLRRDPLKPGPMFGGPAAGILHIGITMQIGFRRPVGIVHIEVIQEHEKGAAIAIYPAQGMVVDFGRTAAAEKIAFELQAEYQVFDQVAVKGLREAAAQRLKIVLKMNKAAPKPSSAAKQQC